MKQKDIAACRQSGGRHLNEIPWTRREASRTCSLRGPFNQFVTGKYRNFRILLRSLGLLTKDNTNDKEHKCTRTASGHIEIPSFLKKEIRIHNQPVNVASQGTCGIPMLFPAKEGACGES
jgi:hypothetical protein